MNTERVAAAAAKLVQARRTGLPLEGLDEAIAPATAEEALAVQAAVAKALNATVGGWKVALDDSLPLLAPIFVSDIARSPAHWRTEPGERLAIEIEIGFRIGRDLDRGAIDDDAAVLDAVAEAVVAIEICRSRFRTTAGLPKLWLLSDHLANHGLVIGDAAADFRRLDLAHRQVRLTIGDRIAYDGIGAHPAGDATRPLLWLARHLAANGSDLRAGQLVITGSLTGPPIEVGPGLRAQAHIEGVGSASLALAQPDGRSTGE